MKRALAYAFCLVSVACSKPAGPPRLTELRGPRLERGMPKPDFVLQRLDGSAFDFRQATRGKVTLLFFGYRNCPDVCPLHLANMAWALRTLPEVDRPRIQVVFVTTDPARDTPDELESWLSRFDASFIGLTGAPTQIEAAQRSLGMAPAVQEGELPKGGGYGITHMSQIWAFTPDDSAHVMYPFGVKREDLAADLKILVRGWPGSP